MKIGITGHQKFDNNDTYSWVRSSIQNELNSIEPPLIGYTSLAIGSDQIFATLIYENGGTVYALIPFINYERAFEKKDIFLYKKLLNKAKEIETLSIKGTDEDSYLEAGKRIVDKSDIIIAVWNNKPAEGKGGTADIVNYARRKNRPLIIINPEGRTIIRSNFNKKRP